MSALAGKRTVLLGAVISLSCAGSRVLAAASKPRPPASTSPIDSAQLVRDESPEPAEPEAPDDPESLDDSSPPRRVRQPNGEFGCGSPRPRACEATQRPVCARIQAPDSPDNLARTVTYTNGCMTCADPSVIAYQEGRCTPSLGSSIPTPSPERQ